MGGEGQLGHQAVGARPIRLVDREDVGRLHEPRLHGLHGVPGLRHEHDHRGVGELHDVELGLPDADRLDEDPFVAGGGQQPEYVPRGPGEAPHGTARGHAADEHPRIERVRLHANAVTEDGARR